MVNFINFNVVTLSGVEGRSNWHVGFSRSLGTLSLTIKKQRKFVQFVAKQKNFTKFALQIKRQKI